MRANGHVYDSCWELHEVDLEEIVLAYLGYGGPLGSCERRWRVIWVELAPAAHRDADRGRHPRACSPLVLVADRDRDGAGLRPRRARGVPRHTSRPGLRQAIRSFTARFDQLGNLLGWLTLVPGLIGVLLAAPFVLELENGTYRLDWTQSITRRRWIAGKLGLAVGARLVISRSRSSCWSPGGGRRSSTSTGGWRTASSTPRAPSSSATRCSPSGSPLAVGVVWRRAVAALVVAFVGYFAARLFVDTWLRQHLTPPISVTFPARKGEVAALNHAWVITEHPSDRFGHTIVPNRRVPGRQPETVLRRARARLHTRGLRACEPLLVDAARRVRALRRHRRRTDRALRVVGRPRRLDRDRRAEDGGKRAREAALYID